MKTLIASLALASVLAFPAFAQSYDPDLGTGNIAAGIEAPVSPSEAHGAYAQVPNKTTADARRVSGQGGVRLQSPYAAYASVTPFGSPANATASPRDAAVRDCNVLAAPYRESTWGTMQIQLYRTCMAQHGDAE